MAPARETGAKYDEQYKKLFAFPRMVEDLVRAFVSQLGASDFSTLRKLSSDYVSDELLKRATPYGGCACPAAVGPTCCCCLSSRRDDHYMALRILIYTGMRTSWCATGAGGGEALPAVLPSAVQRHAAVAGAAGDWRTDHAGGGGTGAVPASAALFGDRGAARSRGPSDNLMGAVIGLEQSRTEADLIRVANALPERLEGSENVELRRVFIDWLTSSMEPSRPVRSCRRWTVWRRYG